MAESKDYEVNNHIPVQLMPATPGAAFAVFRRNDAPATPDDYEEDEIVFWALCKNEVRTMRKGDDGRVHCMRVTKLERSIEAVVPGENCLEVAAECVNFAGVRYLDQNPSLASWAAGRMQ